MDVSDQRIAFERMFRAHHPAVFRYVLRRVEEPAVQELVAETFLVAAPLRVDLVPAPAAGVYSGRSCSPPPKGVTTSPLGACYPTAPSGKLNTQQKLHSSGERRQVGKPRTQRGGTPRRELWSPSRRVVAHPGPNRISPRGSSRASGGLLLIHPREDRPRMGDHRPVGQLQRRQLRLPGGGAQLLA
jgi:hypothetical protein